MYTLLKKQANVTITLTSNGFKLKYVAPGLVSRSICCLGVNTESCFSISFTLQTDKHLQCKQHDKIRAVYINPQGQFCLLNANRQNTTKEEEDEKEEEKDFCIDQYPSFANSIAHLLRGLNQLSKASIQPKLAVMPAPLTASTFN